MPPRRAVSAPGAESMVRQQPRSSKKTVAMFCDGGFLAHVTRSFEVGRALRQCFGHRVVFCCEGRDSQSRGGGGLEGLPVFTVDRNVTMEYAHKLLPPRLSWWKAICAQSVAADLAAMDAIQPDAVVGDMRWSLSTSARARGIPFVSVTNACWTDKFAHPMELPEGHLLEKLLGRRLAEAAVPKVLEVMMAYCGRGYSDVRKQYGLPPIRHMFAAVDGDITLLADLPEFMPVVRNTPPSFRYTGPLLWDATIGLPAWFSKLQKGKPTIYFTMGSTGDTKCFPDAVRVFGNTD